MIVSMALLMVVNVGVAMIVFRTAADYAHEIEPPKAKMVVVAVLKTFADRTGVSVSHPRQ
jgi:hypothetical protein